MAPGSRPDLFALRRRPLRERWLDLGFQRAVVPRANVPKKGIDGMQLVAVSRLDEAIAALR